MKFPLWIQPGLWGVVVGAILLAVVGFNWGGWTTQATAEKMALNQANTAVVTALTPFCVALAQADDNTMAKLEELAAITSASQRRTFVANAGWATMPGQASPSNALATSCALSLGGAES